MASSAHGRVKAIQTDPEFAAELNNAGSKLVVVDFTASWCGPCQMIAPVFVSLSMQYENVVFVKVDVDICRMTATMYSVRAMPTFVFIKNKKEIDRLQGANPSALEGKIKELMEKSDSDQIDPNRVAMGRSFDCFQQLQSNSSETFLDVSELLLRFAKNIMNNPHNPKFRSIRIGNKIFSSRLLPVPGGVECLFTMGFQEDGEHLTFPPSASLDNMHALYDAITDERSRRNGSASSQSSAAQPPARPAVPQTPLVTPPPAQVPAPSPQPAAASRVAPSQVQRPVYSEEGKQRLIRTILSNISHVKQYEQPSLQEKARTVIPVDELSAKAKNRSQQGSSTREAGVSERDCLLLELLHWFKTSFFRWVDQPKCHQCSEKTVAQGSVPPTSEEMRWGGFRVENYLCSKCGSFTRFPRYNHPGKLLESREGRCGEWANCFTLCCRALGFEARYVHDWTDHVWAEVFSESQRRWLHCDPCENICDKPLVYEAGWGKKLSYIIAFSKDEVVDVTWRYSAKHKELCERRKDVPENWLGDTLSNYSVKLQDNLPKERVEELNKRLATELVEFLSEKGASSGESQGRLSGSLAWRQARGETGTKKENKKVNFVFKPSDKEITEKRMRVRYSCAGDTYERSWEDKERSADNAGWDTCTFDVQSVFRKEETDWKMVYLARTEGSATGSISWKIDVGSSDLVIDSVTVAVNNTTYSSGIVLWKLCGEGSTTHCQRITGGKPFSTESFRGCRNLTLTAELSGGEGDVAWQHAQLFRQAMNEVDHYPLDLKITFKTQ